MGLVVLFQMGAFAKAGGHACPAFGSEAIAEVEMISRMSYSSGFQMSKGLRTAVEYSLAIAGALLASYLIVGLGL